MRGDPSVVSLPSGTAYSPPALLHVARPQLPLLLRAQLLSGSEYICPHLSLE